MMKKTIGKTGRNGKGRWVSFWAVSLVASFQALGWVFFSMAITGPVEAKTFVVNSTLDETDTAPGDGVCVSTSGYCTLRAAIQEANALLGPDVIKLKTGLYMLTIPGISENACATGDLDITDDLTITGTGAKNTFINSGKLDRVFHIIDSTVTITDVTIQNGFATDAPFTNSGVGGGILNQNGTLIVKGITISNNAAYGALYGVGGGIYNYGGSLTVTKSTLSNSTISNNSVSGSNTTLGGGIYTTGSNLTIIGASISNNAAYGGDYGEGGGISNKGGTVTLTQTFISNNAVSGLAGIGGGIYNDGGTVTIKGSTISNNTASATNVYGGGGGIFNNGGMVTLTQTSISNNAVSGTAPAGYGGGLHNNSGWVTIKGSTISNNAAQGITGEGLGGGILTEGPGILTIKSASKLLRNFASDEGGGIYVVLGTVTVSPDSAVKKNIPNDVYP